MDNRKIIIASYLGAAAITGLLTHSAFSWFYSVFYQVRRLPYIGLLREAVPIAVAAAVFLVLLKHPKVNSFFDEVVSELKKVTWPSREDVVKSTTVVMICILIASFILAGFDLVWGKVIGFLMRARI